MTVYEMEHPQCGTNRANLAGLKEFYHKMSSKGLNR